MIGHIALQQRAGTSDVIAADWPTADTGPLPFSAEGFSEIQPPVFALYGAASDTYKSCSTELGADVIPMVPL